MFQTEFSGPNYKLVLSWEAVCNESYSTDDTVDDNYEFCRLRELSQRFSKLSTEFVERMRILCSISKMDQLHENIPNVVFKTENLKNLESCSDEISLLRKKVEKLKNEKEELESELKITVSNHESEIHDIKYKQELKLQELEKKYEDEMSDLRVYFENSVKQLTDIGGDHSIREKEDSNLDSINGSADPDYEKKKNNKFSNADLNCGDLYESKIKMKENIGKDLKNVMKTIARKKEKEIQELKKNMEVNYSKKINALQTEINRLLYDKILESNVKEIHSKLKENYEEELQNLQNISDYEFMIKMKNEKENLEKELKFKFENEFIERNAEWEKKIEDLLSEVLVKSAVKSVTDEMKYKAENASQCHCNKNLANIIQSEEQIKQKYEQELDCLKRDYESKINDLKFSQEKNIQKINEEKETLSLEIEELRNQNQLYIEKIQLLKTSHVEYLKSIQRDQEIDTEKIALEASKMKNIYENDVSKLRGEIATLQEENEKLLERARIAENIDYKKVVASLVEEISELINREQIEEYVTWPSELSALKHIFVGKFFNKNLNQETGTQDLLVSVNNMADVNRSIKKYSCDPEVNEMLDQREDLRKVNVSVQDVIKVFTKYLISCENELNNTLIGELVKEESEKKDDESCQENPQPYVGTTTNGENLKKVHFAPDAFEIINLLKDDESLEETQDRNISLIESELNACLERLKNEATAVLQLTSGKKTSDGNDLKYQHSCTQTEIDGNQIERDQEVIRMLQEHLIKAKENMAMLSDEVTRLTHKIISLESIEGYGEALNSITPNEKISNGGVYSGVQEMSAQESEEFCPKCEKTRDEAKKEIDDLTSQVQAASNKIKNMNQFLDRQTEEREFEHEEFDKKIKLLQEQLKEKERDLYSIYKSKFETEITNLEQQIKDLTSKLEESLTNKETCETKLKSADGRIWQLRERNQDLEIKLAQLSELVEHQGIKLKEKEQELLHHQKEYETVLHQLEQLPEGDAKQFEELNEQHVASSALIEQMKRELIEVEKLVIRRTRELENTYVVVTCSNVISSPSEDISVCDRIGGCLRLASPDGSDQSASPVHVPINMLSCLHEKLKKLFRAEEAALKKITDQDMQLNRLTNALAKVELERDTLEENLKVTSAKLAETKIELNNWQHGHQSFQSEIHLELTHKIESLESQIEYYKKYLSQKDYRLSELNKRVRSLELYIANSESEFINKTQKTEMQVDKLQNELQALKEEKSSLQKFISGCQKKGDSSVPSAFESMLEKRDNEIRLLEEKLTSLLSAVENSNRSKNYTDEHNKQNSKGSRVSFADNLESYIDSDVYRHAVVAEVSPVPQYFADTSSEVTGKLSESSELSPCLKKVEEKLASFNITGDSIDDSIDINFDVFSSTKNASTTEEICPVENNVNKSDELLISNLKVVLENERKQHEVTIAKLRDTGLKRMHEKKSWKEMLVEFTKEKAALENQLNKITQDLNGCKDQCRVYETQIQSLMDDLKTKNDHIDDLKRLLNEQKNINEQERVLEQNEFRKKELESERYLKAAVKERFEAQLKCEEYSNNMKRLNELLEKESSKSKNLTDFLEKAKKEIFSLQEALKSLEDSTKGINAEYEAEKENNMRLITMNGNLKTELESARRFENELKRSFSNQYQPSTLENQTGSLRNLTEQVQKEVELAVELDENMLKSLESNSRNSSFLEDMFKISTTLSADLKRLLFKILQEGFEKLTLEEKNILLESCDWQGTDLLNRFKQHNEATKQLQLKVESGQKSNRELSNDIRQMRTKIGRLEMVLDYYDERMSLLTKKLDQYRNKEIKIEIALTLEKSSHKQLEIHFENYKKEVAEKQTQYNKKIEGYLEQLNEALNENVLLKLELESLKNKVETLTAELNSVKVITQYHSDSETELSRTLNPLKVRLTEIQAKYSKIKSDYEKKKYELQTMKSDLKSEINNNQKLEVLFRSTLDEKRELEQQLLEMKTKLDNLQRQKQKLEEKLEAAEVAELVRRKLRTTREDELGKERNTTKEIQRNLETEYEKLKQNLLKVTDEFVALQKSWKSICQEAQSIFLRMLKAEKNQRSLVFQKTFLTSIVSEFEAKYNTAIEIMPDISSVMNYCHITSIMIGPKRKFKSVAFVFVSARRMQFLVNRRASNNHSKMVQYFKTHLPAVKIYPWCNFISETDYEKNSDVARSSNAKIKSREQNAETELLPGGNSLQVLYQQFANLRKTYVLSDVKSAT